MVMGDDSCSRGCGFKSRCRILDGHEIFSHGFVIKNCIDACLNRPKNEKEAGDGSLKKKVSVLWLNVSHQASAVGVQPRPLYRLFSVFSNKHYNFYNNNM